MPQRTEKDVLEKIETITRLERRDIETIKRYVAAGFWVTIITALLVIARQFM